MSKTILNLRKALKNAANEKVRQSGERFFKEPVKLYGVKSADIIKISKVFYIEIKDKPKAEIFALCEELWRSGMYDEGIIACNWSYQQRKNFLPADLKIFEKWVNEYVTNWATCDTFCNHTVGAFLDMYPQYLKELKRWARSENRWTRRAAAVSLIVPARQGKFLAEIFGIAKILLLDEDDLVRKGYGWMLKVAGEAHQKEVFDFVMRHKDKMPRTALRYAIEKMPKELKAKAMAKI